MRALTALVELGLAFAAQYTLNRQMASLRAESQSLVMSLAVFGAVCLIALTGVGFLLAALYEALVEHYGSPLAPAVMGAALFIIAGVVVAIVQWRARRAARAESKVPTMPARELAQKEADAVLDEFKKVLGSASPIAIAAAVAGLAVGIAGAKIGHAVRANGARR